MISLSPLAAYFVIILVQRMIQGEWVDFGLLGEVNFLPNLGIGALFLWIFTYGIGRGSWLARICPCRFAGKK
ncbi:MAG: hypothetical protein IPN96_04400 [Anaerolineales bacterium]|nr:hypothetical protein [Anaerolineales bacterium]